MARRAGGSIALAAGSRQDPRLSGKAGRRLNSSRCRLKASAAIVARRTRGSIAFAAGQCRLKARDAVRRKGGISERDTVVVLGLSALRNAFVDFPWRIRGPRYWILQIPCPSVPRDGTHDGRAFHAHPCQEMGLTMEEHSMPIRAKGWVLR